MHWPVDIATELAKKKEIRDKLIAELAKVLDEIKELEKAETK